MSSMATSVQLPRVISVRVCAHRPVARALRVAESTDISEIVKQRSVSKVAIPGMVSRHSSESSSSSEVICVQYCAIMARVMFDIKWQLLR